MDYRSIRPRRLSLTLLAMAVAAGCNGGGPGAKESVSRSDRAVNRNQSIPQPPLRPKKDRPREELDLIARAYEASRSKGAVSSQAEDEAVSKVATAIRASLEVAPTLAIWLVDRTPSADLLVRQTTEAAKSYYDSQSASGGRESDEATERLLTAIISFDENIEFIVDPPTADAQKVMAGFDAAGERSTSGREHTFAAIKHALEKYLPLRTDERRELLLVTITDEAGDDAALMDDLAATLRRYAIPLYVIGLPAPWGQTNPFAPNPKARGASVPDDSIPTVGPESLFSERVDIAGWSPGMNLDFVDSGFGPFALERLCRASRGQYFAVRPQDLSLQHWPPGNELRFDESVVSKYAPDYVTEPEYRKLLSENKACAALHEAARLPKVIIEGSPLTRFPKDSEAKMAKQSSRAQQFAARNSPAVDQLYAILAPGEADRDKLTSPRWQAQFDLALGRVLAAKVRLDGYNSMIAALKRGKSFAKPDSTTWVLEPAETFETESTLRRLGERAKMYLERVVKEHPGTPWATIAEQELKTPLGWTWKEE